MKTIIVKLKRAGNRTSSFSIIDDLGNILKNNIPKKELIEGVTLIIEDYLKRIILQTEGKNCKKILYIPISTVTTQDLADFKYSPKNTPSMWRHLSDTTIYNDYYGNIYPYIIEYPFSYAYQDEIVQNVKDYSKVYKYLPTENGIFNETRKVQTDDKYFNKSILYNDQQSSGILELVRKPQNNLKEYVSYPKFNMNSKTILFTKSDNFYQYNTFWDVVKDKSQTLFKTSCENLSIDKEVNQDNMNYGIKSFKKVPLRAKDLKCRMILDNSNDNHIVSQFIVTPSQISYK